MELVIYTAACTGNPSNCFYPDKRLIRNAKEMAGANRFDQVFAEYEENHRGSANFIRSCTVPMDVDNDHTENADEFLTAENLGDIFSGIEHAIIPSRSHMREKDGKAARPRYHVLFPVNEITDADAYVKLKKCIQKKYPFFDSNALDAGRFFFGSDAEAGDIVWNEGALQIDDYVCAEASEPPELILEGNRNNAMYRFAVRIIVRFGETERAREAFDRKSEKCEPPLDAKELERIWSSAAGFYRKKVAGSPGYVDPAAYDFPDTEDEGDSWEMPLPFEGEELPDFPLDALPHVLAEYAGEVADSTQTPIDMAAVSVLAVASACMRNLYKVEGKPDWHEPTNIYAVIIAEPSERKSAVTSHVIKPVDAFVRDYNRQHKVDFEVSRSMKQKLENRRSGLINKSRKKGEEKSADDFNDELRKVVEELVNFEEVKPLKIYVDDTTPEKLTETLAENGGAVSIISSEGGIFDVLSGTYSSKVNIDVFLKAYSGERISVERIMRQSLTVDEACLTILLSVQPVVIGEMMGNRKFRHRGLTARFLYTTPKSFIGSRILESAPVSEDAYRAYKELIYDILFEKKIDDPELIRLTDDAKHVLVSYYDWVEQKLTGEYSMYSDWLGKLVGNTLRIAGIMARCSVMKNGAGAGPVQIDRGILENAIKVGKYFLVHSVNAYGDMGVRSDFKASLAALEKLKERGMKQVTRRDIMRLCRWVGTAEEAQAILGNLEDYGYVRLSSIDSSDKLRNGRPKNAVYKLNPHIYD